MGRPKDVDEYISRTPVGVREKLEAVRDAIRTAVPGAEERISYGMPYYHYKGRLAYFRLSKRHIGIYIPTPVLERHLSELKGYEINGATWRIPLDARIPKGLIRKLVRERAGLNRGGMDR